MLKTLKNLQILAKHAHHFMPKAYLVCRNPSF